MHVMCRPIRLGIVTAPDSLLKAFAHQITRCLLIPSLLAVILALGHCVVKGAGEWKYPFKKEESFRASELHTAVVGAAAATPDLRLLSRGV